MTSCLLFDLDGTLVDTDHLHLAAFNQLFAEHGIHIDRGTYTSKVMGRPNSEIAAALLPHLSPVEGRALLERKEHVYRDMITELEPLPGLFDLLDWAAHESIPCGVVTNAPRENAELVLRAIGLADRFDTLVIGDELTASKPDPLPYRTGLARLGGISEKSVAFEDSPSGMRAALGAGLTLIGMMTALPEDLVLSQGATIAVKDYTDPRLRRLIADRLSA